MMHLPDVDVVCTPVRGQLSLSRRLDLALWHCFGQGAWLARRRRLAHAATLLLSLVR